MISLVRVDDRLIHGQVTVGWAPYLRASRIIVVSDRLAANTVLASILRVGVPVGMQIDVVSVEESAALCSQERSSPGSVIVLFERLDDVRRAVGLGLQVQSLNLGGLRGSGEGMRVSDAVFLSPRDQAIIRDLRLRGTAVETRIMPGDRPCPLPEEEA
jgi:mannose/fructose/N-acetylgalactosamine-specific phosphotransferase system component IIB